MEELHHFRLPGCAPDSDIGFRHSCQVHVAGHGAQLVSREPRHHVRLCRNNDVCQVSDIVIGDVFRKKTSFFPSMRNTRKEMIDFWGEIAENVYEQR